MGREICNRARSCRNCFEKQWRRVFILDNLVSRRANISFSHFSRSNSSFEILVATNLFPILMRGGEAQSASQESELGTRGRVRPTRRVAGKPSRKMAGKLTHFTN